MSVQRKVVTDYTLSDGTFLPAGTRLAANLHAIHKDDKNYHRSREFDGFRFARSGIESHVGVHEDDDGDDTKNDGVNSKNQIVNMSTEYLAFGHGRYAWCVSFASPKLIGSD